MVTVPELQPGDRIVGAHATYEVVEPRGFAGVLPTARITDGSNIGHLVILTHQPAGVKPS